MNRKNWVLSCLALLFVVGFTAGFSNWEALQTGISDFSEGFVKGFFS
ncbi:hypothetical protein KFD70_11500 [Bacillus pfraonensis]|nr:hypothetical protein [Bacillus sp. TL12]MCI0763926.1 hypothetical protein [Bacillus sp. TL12]HEK9101921.1 hypothetical protein [Bacillus pseudomycoides]